MSELENLRAMVDVLQGALKAHGMPTIEAPPTWAKDLTPQQRAFMGLLIAAYPKGVSRWEILERLPALDHAIDRSPMLINALASRIRKHLGDDALTTIPGGYRVAHRFTEPQSQAANIEPVRLSAAR